MRSDHGAKRVFQVSGRRRFREGLGAPQQAFAATGEVPRRTLGRTGAQVSVVGVGGFHIGSQSVAEDLGIRIVRTALDSGINFLDNCWDYNDGESERRMGRAFRDGYRQKAFLMTKSTVELPSRRNGNWTNL